MEHQIPSASHTRARSRRADLALLVQVVLFIAGIFVNEVSAQESSSSGNRLEPPEPKEQYEAGRRRTVPIDQDLSKKAADTFIAIIAHGDITDIPYLEQVTGEHLDVRNQLLEDEDSKPDNTILADNNFGAKQYMLNFRRFENIIPIKGWDDNGRPWIDMSNATLTFQSRFNSVCIRESDINKFFDGVPIKELGLPPPTAYYKLKQVKNHYFRVRFADPQNGLCIGAIKIYQESLK